MDTKKCSICKEHKPLDCFHKDKSAKDGRVDECKPCRTIYRKQWRTNHKERLNEQQREKWHSPEKRDYVLRRTYGITLQDYNLILEEQGGGCAICGSEEPGGKRKYLSVDHDHTNGKVRGILCNTCNAAVGFLRDDIERAQRLIAYLSNSVGE